MHQSIPPVPIPRANPRALAFFFFFLMKLVNSPRWAQWQMPRPGDRIKTNK